MNVVFESQYEALVREAESCLYKDPQHAILILRGLIKACKLSDHMAYLYEHMAFAYLLLGEHRLSRLFYEQTLQLKPNNMYAMANLAHVLFELGERDRAVLVGRSAMQEKDQDACAAVTPGISTKELGPPYGGMQNVVVFSLFGDDPRYCETAILNVLSVQQNLPKFQCRFYVDDTVPCEILRRLEMLGAHCVHMGPNASRYPGTFWRFLAMDDPTLDCVVVRDVDALLDNRDAQCILEWQQSSFPFHILRDDCCHTELIMAGMFGIRSGTIRNTVQIIDSFVDTDRTKAASRYSDQLFLRTKVWPLIRDKALTHDRIYSFGQHVVASPNKMAVLNRFENDFIGANHAVLHFQCEFKESLALGEQLWLTIKSLDDVLICRYPMRMVANSTTNYEYSPGLNVNYSRWELYLPKMYEEPLKKGEWRQEVDVGVETFQIGDGTVLSRILGFRN